MHYTHWCIAGLNSIGAMTVKAHLRWTGQVIRTDSSRIPRQLLYAVLAETSGGQRAATKTASRNTWSRRALLRHSWNGAPWESWLTCSNQQGLQHFEECRQLKITAARQSWKATASAPPSASFRCPHNTRVHAFRIGLTSHSRTHQWRLHY